MESSASVLISGGSGYLGQLLAEHFVKLGKTVYALHHSTTIHLPGVQWIKADLASGEGLSESLHFMAATPLSAVINCAAISQPGLCEKDPAAAEAVNIPSKLISALKEHIESTGHSPPLFIHISTDQVYDGSSALSTETDACKPVNAYGRSKLAGEEYVQAHWPHHVILRSSIIYGPEPPVPVSRGLFLQFLQASISSGEPLKLFDDEYRSPIYVQDIACIVQMLMDKGSGDSQLFCMGGPERLSRLEMGRIVGEKLGYDMGGVEACSASTVDRGVVSPADISMCVDRIQDFMKPLHLTRFADAVPMVFHNPKSGVDGVID